MGGKPWTTEELDILSTIVNTCSGPELARRYKQQARKHRLPDRTTKAILNKAQAEHRTVKPLYDNHNVQSLARLLKVGNRRIYNWINQGWIEAPRQGKFRVITNKAFAEFADQRPDIVSRADFDALVFLLGKEKAQEIKKTSPPSNAPQRIVNIANGKVYDSISEAAQQTFYSKRAIGVQLAKGTNWRKVS